jgi:hypothetical protein
MSDEPASGDIPADKVDALEWGDEPWQTDRAVFTREEQPKKLPTGETVTAKVLVVGLHARRHWSDKNPRKFDPDTALKIVQYVANGSFTETAASAAGISKRTLYNWLGAGADPGHPRSTEELRAWKLALDEAEATAEARAVAGILQAGAQSWQAYAWYLERKHSNRWRAKTSLISENPDGSPAAPPKLEVTLIEGGDVTTPVETTPKADG